MKYLGLFIIFMSACAHSLNIVGDDAYAPYSYKEGGQFKGIYTDIINQALGRMGEQHSVKGMPWKRGLNSLKGKMVDALYPPYYRPELRPYMAYSIDILDETPVIFCHKDSAAGLKNFPADYQGKVIGRNAGFVTPVIDEAAKNGIIKIQEVKGMNTNLQKLVNKRVDCYVNDRLSVLFELKKMKAKGKYDGSSVVETSALPAEQGFLAVHVDAPEDTKVFIGRFNETIQAMKADGSIQKVIDSYTK